MARIVNATVTFYSKDGLSVKETVGITAEEFDWPSTYFRQLAGGGVRKYYLSGGTPTAPIYSEGEPVEEPEEPA